MGLFSFGSNKSKSTSTSNSSSFNQGENFSNSGSQQGSSANSFGFDRSQSQQNIYGGQEPYINDIYGQAQNLYQNNAMPERQVAGLNQMQGANAGFATGGGNDIYTQQLMSSLNNMAGYGAAANTANAMSGGNFYNAPMTNGLNYSTLAGAVNNPFLDGQIDAASRDVVRNLGENQLTGNAAAAAGTGNSGSSRRAVMDAIAMRGAADRVADIGSTMRGNAYTQGLEMANRTALANQNAAMGTNAVNANLMSQGANLNYNIGQAGSAGLRDAYASGATNAGMVTDTGNMVRQYQQQVLDATFQNQMNPYNALQFYKGMIGDPTVLSSSNSIGLNGSNSNSFGNSYSNSYGYDTGGSNSTSSATSTSKGFNVGFGGK